MLFDHNGDPFRSQHAAHQPAAFSHWFGTQESPARGRMITPPLAGRDSLTPWAHITLALKSRVLAENYGPGKAISHLATQNGYLSPQAMSGDDAWDPLAEEAFQRVAGSTLIFDSFGVKNFYTYQPYSNKRRWVDGELFTLFTETTSGAARVAPREFHQCRGGGKGWRDGVRVVDDFPAAYRFVDPEKPSKPYVLDARNLFHHATLDLLGGVRGVPVFAHCINDFHDLIETKGFLKHAIKAASLIGLSRTQDSPHGVHPSMLGMGAGTSIDNFSPTSDADGEPVTQKVSVEDVFSGGLVSQVPLQVVADSRPGPSQMEFRKDLLREAAIGIGVPPSIMYFMDEPGGADARLQIDMFAKFVAANHADHLRPFCQRFWVYAIAKEMKAGRLPYPSKGEFWRVRWTPTRSLTADRGKTGRVSIELRKALLTNHREQYMELGLDYEDEMRQCAKEAQMMMNLETEFGLPAGTLTNSLLPANAAAAVPGNDPAAQAA